MFPYNLLKRTTQNEPKPAHMKNLEGLIMRTTAVPQIAVQQGVLEDTKQGLPHMKTHVAATPGSDAASKGKTKVHSVGQVPYSGPMMAKGRGKGMGAL